MKKISLLIEYKYHINHYVDDLGAVIKHLKRGPVS